MMERRKRNRHVMRHVAKSAVAMMAFALVFQPSFAVTVQAEVLYDSSYYDYGYDYNSDRRLLSSTETYDDGTKATAQYRYDERGNVIYHSETYPDGKKYTVERSYNGNTLLKEITYEYDAEYEYSVTRSIESGENGNHVLTKASFGDGRSASKDEWYDKRGNCIKSIVSDSEGTSYQTDSVYNEQGNLITSVTTHLDGSLSRRECQYDEDGELTHDRTYEYDVYNEEKKYVESTYGWNGDTWFAYTIEKINDSDGESTTETWDSSGVNDSVKINHTNADGSQTTEEYHNDTQTGRKVRENTAKNADGSSSYIKYVYTEGYTLESSVNKEVLSDGTEIYEECLLESDGIYTVKKKTEDGVLSVIRLDSDGNQLSESVTLPDGTKSEIFWERRIDGQPVSRVERYSDGSMDKIDYIYNEYGDEIQQTETRRNGVSVVTTIEYTEADKNKIVELSSFNNGCQVETVLEIFEQSSYQVTITYSGGNIAQEIIGETADKSFYLKTIYRDGRVEDTAAGRDDENWTELYYNLRQKYVDNYNSFIAQAWTILPDQAGA